MSRLDNINELLTEVEEISSTLSDLYEQAKKDNSIPHISCAKIKSALEHLRSILDYCAMDAYLYVYGKSPRERLYFPFAEDEKYFNKRLANKFPLLLQKNPKIYHLIASVQPHISGSKWLLYLCHYVNKNKHHNFTSQVRKTKDSVSIGNLFKVSGGGTITGVNSSVNGVPIGRDNSIPVVITDTMTDAEIKGQLNPNNPYLPITRVAEDIKFFIDNSDNDALAFIQDAKQKISQLVNELYLEIR